MGVNEDAILHDVSKPPLLWACVSAITGMILVVIGMATQDWTVTRGVTIGLWALTDDASGVTYSWTGTETYQHGVFFYSTWFTAVRALMMAGIIVGVFGILANIVFFKKTKYGKSHGNVLMCCYFLTFSLVIIAAVLYCAQIPQPINDSGSIITNVTEVTVEYIYLSGYGYSMWLAWIGSGGFLLSAGMSYEGSNQRRKQFRLYGRNH